MKAGEEHALAISGEPTYPKIGVEFLRNRKHWPGRYLDHTIQLTNGDGIFLVECYR